jgi:tetratricopeptide (TPR) repeat protein
MTKRTELLLAAAMAVALTLICYGYSLSAPLMWDDMDVVTPNGVKLAIRDIPSYFTPAHWLTIVEAGPRPYRPLRDSYLAILTDLGNSSPVVFHAGNLALQALNVFLVFLLARRLISGDTMPVSMGDRAYSTATPSRVSQTSHARIVSPGGAFVAAAIFATHPMHTEVIAWTKNCAELLGLALTLLSALAFMRAVMPSSSVPSVSSVADENEIQNPKSKIQNARGLWLLSFLLYGLALLCKESALPLPGLLILWALLWLDGPARKRAILMTLPLWFAGIAYSLYQHGFLSERATAASQFHLSKGAKLLLCAETYGAYLLSLFLPIENRPLPEFWPYPTAGVMQIALVALLIAAAVALLVVQVRRRNRASLGFWWILMALGPVANLVQFNSARPIAEQRLYLPSVGFALLIGAFISGVPSRARQVAAGAAVMMVVAFAALSLGAGAKWSTELDFWRWTVRTSPNLFLPHQNLGNMYAEDAIEAEGAGEAERAAVREGQAQASDLRALWLRPDGADIAFNLGNSFSRRHDYATAAMFYRWSLRYVPGNAQAHFNLATCHLMLGKKQRAISEMISAARFDAHFAQQAHPSLAQLYYDTGDKDRALAQATAALADNPKSRAVHLLAARILEEKGQHAEAAEHIHEALANAPQGQPPEQDAGLFLREGQLWLKAADAAKAEPALQRAASLAPNRVEVQLALGLAELRLGKLAEAQRCLKPLVDQSQGGVEALLGLAELRAKEEKWEEARGLYEAALKASPQNAEAQRGLEEARRRVREAEANPKSKI